MNRNRAPRLLRPTLSEVKLYNCIPYTLDVLQDQV